MDSESLNDLTLKLELEYGVNMQKQSLDSRFNRYAVAFLKKAVGELLERQLAKLDSLMSCDQFDRILIKDSVCFQIDKSLADFYPGSGGSGSPANVRIQFEYDLLSGKIIDLSLNAFNDQDAKNSTMTLEVINEGDLVIRDLAYMHINALQGILKKCGDFLCRLQTNRRVYQLQGDNVVELDFAQIVGSMVEYGIEKIEDKVFLDDTMTMEVRLFIYLLPQAEYEKRIRKAKRRARKKGQQLSREYKARARVNLFITSASQELITLETAWKAYTLRWQIELGFKVWKSLWKIDKVKKVKKERLECYIWSRLFAIVLNLHLLWITHLLMRNHYDQSISFYKASKTLINTLRNRLHQALLAGRAATIQFLVEFLELSRRKHVLEKKKNGNYSPEVLLDAFSLSYDGRRIAAAEVLA